MDFTTGSGKLFYTMIYICKFIYVNEIMRTR